MSFDIIYNPLTNEKHTILSYEGKSLLKQYIKEYQTGGAGQPIALPSKPFNKPSSLQKQPSLGKYLDNEKMQEEEKLKRDSRLEKRNVKQTQQKQRKKFDVCNKIKTDINKVEKDAKKETDRLNSLFNEKNCNKKMNSEVTDAFKGIDPFGK